MFARRPRRVGMKTSFILYHTIPSYSQIDEKHPRSNSLQVLVRMFPFSRGLFEDKVANVWFCLDVFLNLRQRLATPHLAKLSLVSTLGPYYQETPTHE
ncbi:unnamed protein product [Ascophyllum nodosum]